MEPAPAPAAACALCAGEGFTFQQKDDRAVALPCECARGCPACSGLGRVYARDERGYEVLRGWRTTARFCSFFNCTGGVKGCCG